MKTVLRYRNRLCRNACDYSGGTKFKMQFGGMGGHGGHSGAGGTQQQLRIFVEFVTLSAEPK